MQEVNGRQCNDRVIAVVQVMIIAQILQRAPEHFTIEYDVNCQQSMHHWNHSLLVFATVASMSATRVRRVVCVTFRRTKRASPVRVACGAVSLTWSP